MTNKEKKRALLLINAAVIFLTLILHSTNTINIKIFNAVPMVPLALLVALSMFTNELTSAVTGMLIGAAFDSVSTGGSFYHTICFFLLGLAVSFTAHYLFNNNIRSAILLCFLSGCVYYFFRWLLFYANLTNVEDRLPYLLSVGLPSVVYTAIFVIPFYYLEKYLFKKFA